MHRITEMYVDAHLKRYRDECERAVLRGTLRRELRLERRSAGRHRHSFLRRLTPILRGVF